MHTVAKSKPDTIYRWLINLRETWRSEIIGDISLYKRLDCATVIFIEVSVEDVFPPEYLTSTCGTPSSHSKLLWTFGNI